MGTSFPKWSDRDNQIVYFPSSRPSSSETVSVVELFTVQQRCNMMPPMSTRRIKFYVFREVLTPTLLGLAVFTFLLIMGRLPKLTELVLNKGVPLSSILKLFLYLMPTFLGITIPLAFLLGILLGFGRLSAESEFIALKSTGISLYTLLKPVLIFALFWVAVTGSLTLYGEPAGKSAFRNQIFAIASDRASVGIEAGIFNDSFDGLILYAEEMDEKRDQMQNVFISDERSAKEPANIFARYGRFIRNDELQTLTLRLSKGTIHHLGGGEQDSYQTIGFSTYDINLDIGKGLAATDSREKPLGEYTPRQLIEAKNRQDDPRKARRFSIELHHRINIAAVPLAFALLGIPLGLQSSRSGKGAGFAMALGIGFCYFILLSMSNTLDSNDFLPVGLILYVPNLVFIAAGIFTIHRAAIEKPVRLSLPLKRIFTRSGKRGR